MGSALNSTSERQGASSCSAWETALGDAASASEASVCWGGGDDGDGDDDEEEEEEELV